MRGAWRKTRGPDPEDDPDAGAFVTVRVRPSPGDADGHSEPPRAVAYRGDDDAAAAAAAKNFEAVAARRNAAFESGGGRKSMRGGGGTAEEKRDDEDEPDPRFVTPKKRANFVSSYADGPPPVEREIIDIVTALDIPDKELVEMDKEVRVRNCNVPSEQKRHVQETIHKVRKARGYSTRQLAIRLRKAGLLATWINKDGSVFFGWAADYAKSMGTPDADTAISTLTGMDADK